jgi:hypothetical protein
MTAVALADDKLEALTKSEDNWAMQGKIYSANHYISLTQIKQWTRLHEATSPFQEASKALAGRRRRTRL